MPNEVQMNTRRAGLLLAFVAVLVLAVVAGVRLRRQPLRGGPGTSGNGSFLVVATTFPLYDFTRVVADGAGGVRVEHMLPFAIGPHDFSPTAETAALVANANVVVTNGLGLDAFADKLIAAGGNTKAVVVNSSLGVIALSATSDGEGGASGVDPHIWLDPRNAVIQVQQIRDALIKADPPHKTTYEQNAGWYVTRLNQLDQNFSQVLGRAANKNFVSYHSAFRYLAKRYGLHEVAVLEPIPGKEPSAKEISDLEAAIRRANVRTIFSEPQFSPKIVAAIANDLKLEVSSLDPIETASEGDSYLSLMRQNLGVLQHGLR